jgi:hypothetical protein
VFLGNGQYFVSSDVGGGKMQWYGFHKEPPGGTDPEGRRKERLLEIFGHWTDDVVDLIKATPEVGAPGSLCQVEGAAFVENSCLVCFWGAASEMQPRGAGRRGEGARALTPQTLLSPPTPQDDVLRRDIFDRAPIFKWHEGRVVLLGDSAHAMQPNLGQVRAAGGGGGGRLGWQRGAESWKPQPAALPACCPSFRGLPALQGPAAVSLSPRRPLVLPTPTPNPRPPPQGGCMAIEDALTLSELLVRAQSGAAGRPGAIDVGAVFHSYQDARMMRAAAIHGMAGMAAMMAATYKAYLGEGLGPLSWIQRWKLPHPGRVTGQVVLLTTMPAVLGWVLGGNIGALDAAARPGACRITDGLKYFTEEDFELFMRDNNALLRAAHARWMLLAERPPAPGSGADATSCSDAKGVYLSPDADCVIRGAGAGAAGAGAPAAAAAAGGAALAGGSGGGDGRTLIVDDVAAAPDRHARAWRDAGSGDYFLQHLAGGRAGTWVNGRRLGEAETVRLMPGDLVEFGRSPSHEVFKVRRWGPRAGARHGVGGREARRGTPHRPGTARHAAAAPPCSHAPPQPPAHHPQVKMQHESLFCSSLSGAKYSIIPAAGAAIQELETARAEEVARR